MQKLRWGLVGGGEGSQIGFTHRAAAQLDGHFYFDAGALELIFFGRFLVFKGASETKSEFDSVGIW